MHRNLRRRFGEPFTDAHVNWDARPTPVVDEQTQRDECFRAGLGINPFLLAIRRHRFAVDRAFAVLPTHDIAGHIFPRVAPDRTDHLHLFVATRGKMWPAMSSV